MAKSQGTVKLVVSILIIAAAAGILYYYFGIRTTSHGVMQDRPVLAIAIKTGEKVEAILKKGESFPLKNLDTGEETLWRAYVNYDKKFLFPGTPGVPVMGCPITGDPKVGEASLKEHKDYPVEMPPDLQ